MEMPDVIVTWKKVGPGTREGLMVFGALFLVISLILIWAIFVRKPPRKRKYHYHYPSTKSHPNAVDGGGSGEAPAKKKWRRRRREHRPRNPTLSETGGLPPIRPDGSSGSSL
jgi:hypothetical protein